MTAIYTILGSFLFASTLQATVADHFVCLLKLLDRTGNIGPNLMSEVSISRQPLPVSPDWVEGVSGTKGTHSFSVDIPQSNQKVTVHFGYRHFQIEEQGQVRASQLLCMASSVTEVTVEPPFKCLRLEPERSPWDPTLFYDPVLLVEREHGRFPAFDVAQLYIYEGKTSIAEWPDFTGTCRYSDSHISF